MGKIEKLVVLGVLGLIVVILAVTFTPPESSEGPVDNTAAPDGLQSRGGDVVTADLGLEQATGTKSTHIDRNRTQPMSAQEPKQDLPIRSGETTEVRPKSPLLNTGVVLEEKVEPQVPEGSILITLDGLTDSALDDFKLYRPIAGDTYPAIAERFYGDARYVRLLEMYNEGQSDLTAGRPMFVPVFEVEMGEEIVTAEVSGDVHLVADGESLWTIAADHLGSGAKWTQLHEANLDVLPNPHDLKPGMKLKIPR